MFALGYRVAPEEREVIVTHHEFVNPVPYREGDTVTIYLPSEDDEFPYQRDYYGWEFNMHEPGIILSAETYEGK